MQQGEWGFCTGLSRLGAPVWKAVVATEPGWLLASPTHLENREMVGIQPCFCPRHLAAAFTALSLNQLTGSSLSPPAIPVAGSG